jgi:predicted permease
MNSRKEKDAYHDQWGIASMESLFKDLAFGVRSLRRDPGFTIVAVLALTLGVAFTVCIFTVVNGVLINPLDLPDPDQIVIFLRNTPYGEMKLVSYPNFLDWRKQQESFVELAASRYMEFNLSGANSALRVQGHAVTPGFFTVLGVQPLFGPGFSARSSDTSRLAVLGYDTWRKAFGNDPSVIGRMVLLDDQAYQVCGILPPGQIPYLGRQDIFVLLDPTVPRYLQKRQSNMLRLLGRMKPGLSLQEAQVDIDLISSRLERAYTEAREHVQVKLKPLQEDLVGETRPRLLALMGAVAFVLMIACLNTASLLLTRGSLRAREVAVRTAIGATRFRIIRQFLVESLVLALFGSLLGLGLASLSVRFLRNSFPSSVPRLHEATIDSRVLAFAMVLAIASALVFGLVPAIKNSRTNLANALKEGASSTTHTSSSLRLRSTMVVVQVALSAVLVIGAGLLVKSYWLLTGVKLGFRTKV